MSLGRSPSYPEPGAQGSRPRAKQVYDYSKKRELKQCLARQKAPDGCTQMLTTANSLKDLRVAQASLGVLYLFSLLYKKYLANTTFWGIDPDPGACALHGHLAPLASPSVLLGGLTPTLLVISGACAPHLFCVMPGTSCSFSCLSTL